MDLLPLKSGAKFLSTHPDGAGSEAFLEIYGCDRDTLMADVNANLRLIKRVVHNGVKMKWYRLQLDAEMVQYMSCAAGRLLNAFVTNHIPAHLARNSVIEEQEEARLAKNSWTV